jgi:hypothetical protein
VCRTPEADKGACDDLEVEEGLRRCPLDDIDPGFRLARGPEVDRGGLARARCHRHRLTVIAILRLRPQADLVTWTPTLIADAAGLNGFLAILLGTITGVGGGVLRDILTGNKPIFLVESTPLRASLGQLCCSCSSRLE